MEREETTFKTEYQEMLQFVCELQESALETYDAILAQKKELEYKKRQQEFVIAENEKKKIPNISMFSPLATEDFSGNEVKEKDELEKILKLLSEKEEQWQKQKQICQTFDKLKKYITDSNANKRNNKFNELTDYSAKILETQEMDRNRISRDLHDSTVQSLTSLGHKMEYCSKMVDRDPIQVKLELQAMGELNKEIINDMREIIYDLRPMSLNNLGLVSTVEAYCLHLRRSSNMEIEFRSEGKERELNSVSSVTLYRIIQEACNNAIRHSMGRKILVSISFSEESVKTTIADNGVGFVLQDVEKHAKENSRHSFGLPIMKERVRLLSGSLFVDTKPGEGTKITVIIPIS